MSWSWEIVTTSEHSEQRLYQPQRANIGTVGGSAHMMCISYHYQLTQKKPLNLQIYLTKFIMNRQSDRYIRLTTNFCEEISRIKSLINHLKCYTALLLTYKSLILHDLFSLQLVWFVDLLSTNQHVLVTNELYTVSLLTSMKFMWFIRTLSIHWDAC
jgi:hypothetical protein